MQMKIRSTILPFLFIRDHFLPRAFHCFLRLPCQCLSCPHFNQLDHGWEAHRSLCGRSFSRRLQKPCMEECKTFTYAPPAAQPWISSSSSSSNSGPSSRRLSTRTIASLHPPPESS